MSLHQGVSLVGHHGSPSRRLASLVGSSPSLSLPDLGRDLAWQDDTALCAQADPELFFPDRGEGSVVAKRLCASCPLQQACLAYAVPRPDVHGIWGGTSDNERKRMRNNRVRQRAAPAVCGTDSGYYRHRRTLLESACDECLAAHAAAERQRGRGAA